MTILSNEQLITLNSQGIIPGPNESEEEYARRAEYCLTLRQHLGDELISKLPEESTDPEIKQPSLERLRKFYDITPSWIPLFFSNYRLPFWHGGCAWIFQVEETTPTAALIQLRQTFRDSTTYLGIYSREELLTHELTHVSRMAFQEPRFEEVLAYKTSTSKFRRWLGPVVQSSTESVIFVLTLFIIIVFDFFLVAMHRFDAYAIALWLKVIPLGMITYGLYRVWRKQRVLDRCISTLEKRVGGKAKAQAVALRLTDSEIESFSSMPIEAIEAYAERQSEIELRWRAILVAYFSSLTP